MFVGICSVLFIIIAVDVGVIIILVRKLKNIKMSLKQEEKN